MAFTLRGGQEIDAGARRVATKQLEKAIDELAGGADAVHGVRKRTKRVRAVARLVRSGIGKDYRRVNHNARDAAALLSVTRDGQALLATFDALVAAADSSPGDLLSVRNGLADQAAAGEPDVDAARDLLTDALTAARRWAFADGDDVLASGLRATYRRGRNAFDAVQDSPTPEAFHEWRKATKHLWYQTQLLEASAPSVLHGQERAFHDLSDSLGDDHDLAVLIERLDADPDAYGGRDAAARAIDAAHARGADLERRAIRLGARLLVESPKAWVARMTGYWEAWEGYGDEEPAGEIGDITVPGDDLHERSRDELYALARRVELPGRSRLRRDELVAHLRARG
jgi:CHAD domain-containing protein